MYLEAKISLYPRLFAEKIEFKQLALKAFLDTFNYYDFFVCVFFIFTFQRCFSEDWGEPNTKFEFLGGHNIYDNKLNIIFSLYSRLIASRLIIVIQGKFLLLQLVHMIYDISMYVWMLCKSNGNMLNKHCLQKGLINIFNDTIAYTNTNKC